MMEDVGDEDAVRQSFEIYVIGTKADVLVLRNVVPRGSLGS